MDPSLGLARTNVFVVERRFADPFFLLLAREVDLTSMASQPDDNEYRKAWTSHVLVFSDIMVCFGTLLNKSFLSNACSFGDTKNKLCQTAMGVRDETAIGKASKSHSSWRAEI